MDRVRELAGRRQEPVVTSLYLDVDGRHNPRPVDYQRHLTTLRKQVEERLEGDGEKPPHDYRMSVRGDLERIGSFVTEGFDRSNVRGLAFFACSAHDWFEVVELPFAVGDQAALDERPRVRQLELLLAEQRTYGMVLVDRRRVRVFRATPEAFEELTEKYEFVGSRKERGGPNGPGLQRHVDENSRRHYREFAGVIRDAFAQHPVDEIVVGATEEDFAEFRGELDRDLAERICRLVSIDTTAPPDEVRTAVNGVAEQRVEQRRSEVLDRFAAAVNGEEPAAAGLAQVIDALNMKRVELMLVSEGYVARGRRCPADGMLALEGEECPACGTPLEDVEDIVDEAVVRALEADAPVYRIPDDRLQRFGQIGAILRW
jgi:peptide subunit release factor 1 (eRF1)